MRKITFKNEKLWDLIHYRIRYHPRWSNIFLLIPVMPLEKGRPIIRRSRPRTVTLLSAVCNKRLAGIDISIWVSVEDGDIVAMMWYFSSNVKTGGVRDRLRENVEIYITLPPVGIFFLLWFDVLPSCCSFVLLVKNNFVQISVGNVD